MGQSIVNRGSAPVRSDGPMGQAEMPPRDLSHTAKGWRWGIDRKSRIRTCPLGWTDWTAEMPPRDRDLTMCLGFMSMVRTLALEP